MQISKKATNLPGSMPQPRGLGSAVCCSFVPFSTPIRQMLGLTFTSPHHGSLSPARPQTPLRFQSARSLDQRTRWSSIGPFAFSWPYRFNRSGRRILCPHCLEAAYEAALRSANDGFVCISLFPSMSARRYAQASARLRCACLYFRFAASY